MLHKHLKQGFNIGLFLFASVAVLLTFRNEKYFQRHEAPMLFVKNLHEHIRKKQDTNLCEKAGRAEFYSHKI